MYGLLVQMIPQKQFTQQKINPIPGVVLNFDGRIGKILTVSGGRVMVDFNNPLSGKNVSYEIEVLKKLEDVNEKVKSINDFLFQKEFKFEVKGKKVIIESDKIMKRVLE